MTAGITDLITAAAGPFTYTVNGVTALVLNGATGAVTATIVAATKVLVSSAVGWSVTGTTAETQLVTFTVPAGLLGTTGGLRVTTTWSATANANNKIYRVRFSGSGGTGFLADTVTTTPAKTYETFIYNKNSASLQVGGTNGFAGSTSPTSAVNTAVATTVYISCALAVGTDTGTLVAYTIEYIPGV